MAADPRPTIDRAFAVADKVMTVIGDLVGAPLPQTPRAREVAHQAPSTSAQSTNAPGVTRFRITEATDAETGQAFWAVSNGTDRAECNSPELAQRVFDALSNGAPR